MSSFCRAPEWKESDLESQIVEVVEAMIAPALATDRQNSARIAFSRKIRDVSAWRSGSGEEEIFTELADMPLDFGDALLLQGTRDKLAVLAADPDLILLVSKGETAITVPNKGLAAIDDLCGDARICDRVSRSHRADHVRRRTGDDAYGNNHDRSRRIPPSDGRASFLSPECCRWALRL